LVLDVSGSMGEHAKLPLGRSAVEQMISDLRPEDRFDIVSFNIAPEAMAPASLPGEQKNKDKAKEYLGKLNAAGGTDLLAALQLAANLQVDGLRNAIVLLSDGQATTTDDHAPFVKLLGEQKAKTTVFSFGIGNDVNRPLLGTLAERTGGFADYVSGQEDLARKVESLRKKIDSPVMNDVKIDWGNAAVEDVVPATLPPLYRGQQLVVFGRYGKAVKGPITLTATIQGKKQTLSADVEWPDRIGENPEVERMWAQRACEALNQAINAKTGGEKERRQIVELGTTFSIVTPYTSFLVLENEAQFSRYGIERINRERIADERAQQETRNAWNPTPAPGGQTVARNDPPPSRHLGGGGGGGGGGAVEGTFLGLLGLLLTAALPGWAKARKEK
ncbi:MAG: VWA domain-containing protein, partial [Phycisphaerae bacterium]|nr:VWA domain-containing protein [Phycisphaerae bacterium]